MNDIWKKHAGDFNSMTDKEIAQEVAESMQRIEREEEWLEAVTSWEAAGKPRHGENPEPKSDWSEHLVHLALPPG